MIESQIYHEPDLVEAPTRCPNGLIRTHLVSFPRSGHHLLVRGLTEALDHKLVYSEYYSCLHNMDNCPFVNLQKSHDFDDQTIDEEANYIVMIRGFELAIESWYNTHNREETFEHFRDRKQEYFDRFLSKWVTSEMNNRLLINYEYFVDHKVGIVMQAARHMGVKGNIDKVKAWEARERKKIVISKKSLHLTHEADLTTGPIE